MNTEEQKRALKLLMHCYRAIEGGPDQNLCDDIQEFIFGLTDSLIDMASSDIV